MSEAPLHYLKYELRDRLPMPRAHVRTIDSELRYLSRILQTYGVGHVTRRAVIDDLRADLEEAVAAGASLESVLGPDIHKLAAGVAEANGRAPVPFRLPQITLAMGIPMAAMALLTFLLIGGGPMIGLPEIHIAVPDQSSNDGGLEAVYDSWMPFVVYSISGMLGVVFALACTAGVLRLQNDTRAGETIRRILVLVPVGCAAGGFAAGGISNFGANTRDGQIPLMCIVAAICVAASFAAAREWARRIRPAKPALAEREPTVRSFVAGS